MAKVVYDIYQLKPTEEEVKLTVIIGHSQTASTIVKLDGNEIQSAEDNFTLSIGKNKDLENRDLKIISMLTDIQESFDVVSQTISLNGGKEFKTWVLSEPSQDGETYLFTTTIGFFL